jgi:hypothetical protein
MMICNFIVELLPTGSNNDAAAFMALYEDQASAVLGAIESSDWIPSDAYDKYWAWPYMAWRLGEIDANQCALICSTKVVTYPNSHLYLGVSTSACIIILELYDFAVANSQEALGEVSQANLLLQLGEACAWLEMVGKRSPFVKCWALLTRACIMRRNRKVKAALKVLITGIETASRTSSRVCLSLLWLERGLCEKTIASRKYGAVGALARAGTAGPTHEPRELRNMGDRRSGERGAGGGGVVVRPEQGAEDDGDCVKSFNLSCDVAMESGAVLIAAKALVHLESVGHARTDGLSKSFMGMVYSEDLISSGQGDTPSYGTNSGGAPRKGSAESGGGASGVSGASGASGVSGVSGVSKGISRTVSKSAWGSGDATSVAHGSARIMHGSARARARGSARGSAASVRSARNGSATGRGGSQQLTLTGTAFEGVRSNTTQI